MFQLRPYQAEAKQAILAAWDEGYRKTLLVLPTGCGKTVVFSSVTEDQVKKGHRVLIMAHRGELLDQAADKLREASGLDSVLEKAESSSLGSFLPVTGGAVQALAQEKRLAGFPNVLDHFPAANILGVTATPDRGDMKNLGEFFDSKAYEYSMTEAIRQGYLCPIKAQMIPLTAIFLFLFRTDPRQHLQEMSANLLGVHIVRPTDETDGVWQQDVTLRLFFLVFLPFLIFLVCDLLHAATSIKQKQPGLTRPAKCTLLPKMYPLGRTAEE